jgi:hypothetical protein
MIYQHWPTRADLLRDACSTIGTPPDVPDTGNVANDVIDLMTNLVQLLRTAKWTSVLPSIVDAAEPDSEIAGIYGKLQHGYSKPFETGILRAAERHELPDDTDPAILIAAFTGPLFYRRRFSREPLTNAFATKSIPPL